jgi:NAD(P)-dependent dehydrogenase (short-subunit alcohol dehydrogenase family)
MNPQEVLVVRPRQSSIDARSRSSVGNRGCVFINSDFVNLNFEGKVVIVTGASSGIGRAAALAFAAEGAKVVGASRRSPREHVEGISHFEVDLSDVNGPERMIEHAVQLHGRLDVLVNNAAAGQIHPGFRDESDEEWISTLNLNLLAAVRSIRAALPHLLVHGGVIVNVTSVNGRLPTFQAAAYSASKAALLNLGKAVSIEYVEQGVRVVTVSPGLTATPMWLGPDGIAHQIAQMAGGEPESISSGAAADTPMKRFLTPEEIADCVCFVASTRASAVTGTEFVVDGGITPTM